MVSEKRKSRSNNQKLSSMKKSLKKLSLGKKSVSNLSVKIKGGFKKPDDTFDTQTTGPTGPTAMTRCFICPPDL